jgi:hypothetical protein
LVGQVDLFNGYSRIDGINLFLNLADIGIELLRFAGEGTAGAQHGGNLAAE